MRGLEHIAEVLGLPHAAETRESPFKLITRIQGGLPFNTVDRVAVLLAPDDTQFKYRLVPKATYDRRKGSGDKLSLDQGTKLARVARIWSLAIDVWKREDDARDFLFRPHPMIEDERPIDVVLQSEFGAEMVVEILGGLKYGSAA